MRRKLILLALTLSLAVPTIGANALSKDEYTALINECKESKRIAHCMAEDARALDYDENSFIVECASMEWWKAHEEQKEYEAKLEEMNKAVDPTCEMVYTARQFKSRGVVRWNGYRWTWYSQRVLPGKGLKIPGRNVDSNGYVCDGDGYICLASKNLAKGTKVTTPFGKQGKVYDRCGIYGTLDVYVNW